MIGMQGLIRFLLKKWRHIVVSVVILGIIGCGYYGVKNYILTPVFQNDAEYVYAKSIYINVPAYNYLEKASQETETEDKIEKYTGYLSYMDKFLGTEKVAYFGGNVYAGLDKPVPIAASIDKEAENDWANEKRMLESYTVSVAGSELNVRYISPEAELSKYCVEQYLTEVKRYVEQSFGAVAVTDVDQKEYVVNVTQQQAPSLSGMVKQGLIFGLLGLMLILFLLVLAYLLFNTVKDEESLTSHYTIPLAGAMHWNKKGQEEHLSTVKANLVRLQAKEDIKILLFASSLSKKFDYAGYVRMLCQAFATGNRKVLFVDWDKKTSQVYSSAVSAETLSFQGKDVAEINPEGYDQICICMTDAHEMEHYYEMCRQAGGVVLMERQDVTNLERLKSVIYNMELQDVNLLAFWLLNR